MLCMRVLPIFMFQRNHLRKQLANGRANSNCLSGFRLYDQGMRSDLKDILLQQ